MIRNRVPESYRVLLRTVAAVGVGAWVGTQRAHAAFNLQWTKGATLGSETAWILSAQNDGLGGAQQPTNTPTGTGIVEFDVTLSTPGSGTAGAMFIDLAADIDYDESTDADITGQMDAINGMPTPSFGSTTGSFMGISSSASSYTKTVSTTMSNVNSVLANGHTALYATTQTKDNDTSELDPTFLSGTVHSLEMVVQPSIIVNDTSAHPIANLVIPTGITGTAVARLTGSGPGSATETYTLSTAAGPSIRLTSSSANAAAAPPITLVGTGNGGYQPVEVSVAANAQTTGALTVTNFSPASDKEIYVLEANSNGTPLTPAQVTQVISDLQSAVAPTNAVVGTFASLGSTIDSLFRGTYDIAVTFPTGNSASAATNPDVLAYDFSQYTAVPNVTISAIGVVPEPSGFGVLVLGGIGLMARRRRMAKASA